MRTANYRITFARSARKELEHLDDEILLRILHKIESLAHAPQPRDAKKLRGRSALWRIRAGDYRVIYSIDDATRVVDISAIRHRSK